MQLQPEAGCPRPEEALSINGIKQEKKKKVESRGVGKDNGGMEKKRKISAMYKLHVSRE